MSKTFNWKIFFILLGLSLLSVVCVFPYVMTIQKEAFDQIGLTAETIFAAQMIQSLILFSIAIALGMFFCRKIGFGLPVLEAAVKKGDYKKELKSILKLSVISGIIVAVTIYALDALFIFAGTSFSTHQSYAPIWQKLLAAVYGGVTEEVLMRLLLMSFFIWLGSKILGHKRPSGAAIIVSIFLAAIIFGLGHLPITASLTKINSLVVTRAIVLNGVGGVVFGWLFWKKGLESAMIAHFTTDVVLLSLLPMIFR